MAGYRKYELVQQASSSPFYIKKTSIVAPSASPFFLPSFMDEDELSLALDVLSPSPLFPKASLFDLIEKPSPFDLVFEDLVQIETAPSRSSYKRVVQYRRPPPVNERYLQKLSDRVSALESKFDRMLKLKEREQLDRKYTWTAEIGGKVEKKYKVTAEIKGVKEDEEKRKNKKKNKENVGERSYKWIAEIKGKDDGKRTYTWKATVGADSDDGDVRKKGEKKKKKEKKDKRSCEARIVEIEDPIDHHRAVILQQAFAKRVGVANKKGKTKEFSPQDAALLIQLTFREYLIRRSRALRALRELAIAKTKLKELRALFHNFSYRNRVSRDAEERQKFAEKIIVLLLTVDSIEGADLMVRSAKRSMVDELEAMLDVVDPQPGHAASGGRSLSMKRRTFDMPSGDIQKEIAEGVAQVVKMIEQEESEEENASE